MKKISKSKVIFATLACILIMGCLTACSTNYEKELLGSWYSDPWGYQFELYSDGTCDISGEYGTGTWAIVNDNQLKVTNFYGEVTDHWTIDTIKDGHITFAEGYELWNAPVD